jgi:hypothetical protein
MSTNLSPDGGGMLPVTGFGPGTILVAVIGGVLTLGGVIMRRISRRPVAATA